MRQNLRLILLLLATQFLFQTGYLFGQGSYPELDFWNRNPISNPIISPPPTASGLGKYVEIPVSQYTGVPNITIPLYEIIMNNGYSMPVSLSYHAAGMKVQQRAGNVGLGWSLNAGGVITRVVKGMPDDQDTIMAEGRLTIGKLFHPNPTPAQKFDYDIESDLYYYNFNGYSGKFYFNKNNEIVFSGEEQPLTISYEGDTSYLGIPQFTITTHDGVKYIFHHQEVVIDVPMQVPENGDMRTPWYLDVIHGDIDRDISSVSPLLDSTEMHYYRHISSWYLSDIEFPNTNETITFEYKTNQYNYVEKTGETRRFPHLCYLADWKEYFWTYKVSLIDGLFLSKISFDKGYVSFIQSEEREDAYDSETNSKLWYNDDCGTYDDYEDYYGMEWYLDSVKVFDADQQIVKEYDLIHNYFISPEIDTAYTGWDHLYKRLKLDSIQEVSDESKPPYIFTYSADSLPHRYDAQIDFWGYYNENSAPDQIPELWIDTTYTDSVDATIFRSIYYPIQVNGYEVDTVTTYGWDRNADECANQACVLKKITYPMGGYDEFTFETNRFRLADSTYLGGGLRIKKIATLASPNDTVKTREYSYVDEQEICSGRIINYPLFAKYNSPPWWGNFYNDKFIDIYSNSLCDLGSTKGSIVGYKNVQIAYKGAGVEKYAYSLQGTLGEKQAEYDPVSEEYVFERFINELYNDVYYTVSVNTVDHYPFLPDPDFDWCRGQLLNKKIYDKNGSLLKRIDHSYKIDYVKDTMEFKGTFIQYVSVNPDHIPNCVVNGKAYAKYIMLSGWKYLAESKEYTYDQEDSTEYTLNTTRFDYTDNHAVRKSTFLRSDGNCLVTRYKYASDYPDNLYTFYTFDTQSDAIRAMQDRNMKNIPIETIQVLKNASNQSVLDGSIRMYKSFNRDHATKPWLILPDEVLKLKLDGPLTYDSTVFDSDIEVNGMFNYSFNYNSNYQSELKIDQYDEYKGNLQQYHKTNDTYVSFIWGYDSTYPIAQVANASYGEIFHTSFEDSEGSSSSTARTGNNVKSLSGVYFVNKVFATGSYIMTYFWRSSASGVWILKKETKTYSGSNLHTNMSWGQIDELRVYPTDAQMTTYTYDPLVGMTSQTDPNGQSTYYEYDDSGRLIRIKNSEGHLLEEYEYNYANQ